MNFSTVVPMLNSVDRLLNLLNLSLSTEFTEFENNNLGYSYSRKTYNNVFWIGTQLGSPVPPTTTDHDDDDDSDDLITKTTRL